MANWLSEQLRAVGVTTQLADLGKQHLEGQEIPLPPAILGKLGNDKNKKTILVYGHFDVQPVSTIGLSILSIC
jgi:Cys-Gly metallodipeptidase DUG1